MGDGLWASSQVLVIQVLFLASGAFSTLGTQVLFYNGAGDTETMLPALASFFGNLLAFFLPRDAEVKASRAEVKEAHANSRSNLHGLVAVGTLETAGFILGLLGINYAGSGIYQVIYASIVVWVALLSRLFLRSNVTWTQWMAILIVTTGVALGALGSSSAGNHALIGVMFTLVSAITYASSYIFAEKLLRASPPVAPSTIQSFGGFFSFAVAAIYVLFYTLPRRETFIEGVGAAQGDWLVITYTYAALVVAALAHGWAYYQLLKRTGSLATGILQSLRAVTVFYLSSILFCQAHPEQCFNSYKMISTGVVVVGVLYFTYLKSNATPSSPSHPKRTSLVTLQATDV